MTDLHICTICGYLVDWKFNEETALSGWWCETCGEWIPEKDIKAVPDEREAAVRRAERRGVERV